MSVCDGCGHDNIYGSRQDRRDKARHVHTLMWLCAICRARLLDLPIREPEARRSWALIPSVSVVSLAAVLISVILAIGAHW